MKYRSIIENYLDQVFVALRKEFKKEKLPDVIFKSMRYSVFNGGKRIRPVLCLAAYDIVKSKKSKDKSQNYKEILPFGCGIEFVHTFSLIQDDLPCMDNDDFRRGKPSLHRVFGEGIAILAADALFAKAFELFATADVDNNRKLLATTELARVCGPFGLVAGQVMDISKKSQKSEVRSQKLINEKKTAEIIAGSLTIGAIIAGAKTNLVNKLYEAGMLLGLLFQTTDDIIDKGHISEVKLHRLEAERYARKANKIFSALGSNFDWFNNFTNYILTRKA